MRSDLKQEFEKFEQAMREAQAVKAAERAAGPSSKADKRVPAIELVEAAPKRRSSRNKDSAA